MQKKQLALLAIVGGVVIFLIKLVAFFVSDSVALLSDALESTVNIAASGLLFFSVWLSEKPPDDSHNYGHQKIEDITCMVEGFLILAAALLIVYAGVGRLFVAVVPVQLDLAIGVSVVATGLNGGLSLVLGRAAKATGSAALEGDSKHLLSDVISSAGVWVGLVIVYFTGWSIVDPLVAFVIAALIARMGIGLITKSCSGLMDKACKEEESKIREVLLRHRFRFIDFHDMKTRRHGNRVLCELHLSVDGSLSVNEAHDLTEHLEDELKQELPNASLTIHIEPPQNATTTSNSKHKP
ncbi:MAG: cation diffusion facilitator family transporter [Candidatus Bathyarchaeota archaeon]|nr:cation diffusion facilitator family transporter [Candidatus Bathyarchaeota archaeon]